MQVFRLCLKDNSSIHIIAERLEDIHKRLECNKFIETREGELVATDHIKIIRASSKTVEDVMSHNNKLKEKRNE